MELTSNNLLKAINQIYGSIDFNNSYQRMNRDRLVLKISAKVSIELLSKVSELYLLKHYSLRQIHFELSLPYKYIEVCFYILEIQYDQSTTTETSRQLMKETLVKKYPDDPFHCKAMRDGFSKKYANINVENPFQLQSVKDKTKETNLKKYGCEFAIQNKEVQQKRVETNLKKYGYENNSQTVEWREKVKFTSIRHFGTEHPAQAESIKLRIRMTNLKKYGTPTFAQSELGKGSHKKLFIYNNEQFDSFPELCFYIYHKVLGNNIKHETTRLEYWVNNKQHFYFPDFELDHKLIEIKGNHFLAEDGSWKNPFDSTEEAQQLARARYQCAIDNGVIILYKKDYQKYINWFYNHKFKKIDFEYKV